jgi:hypothetical protein
LHYHPLIYRIVYAAIKPAVCRAGAVFRQEFQTVSNNLTKRQVRLRVEGIHFHHIFLHTVRYMSNFNLGYPVVMPNQVNKRNRPSQLYIFYNISPNYVLQISACRSQKSNKNFWKNWRERIFINKGFCLKIIDISVSKHWML